MSLRGATVITNSVTALPAWGPYIAYRVRGGSAVDNATPMRSFSPHHPSPSILLGTSPPHPSYLHLAGPQPTAGAVKSTYKITLSPYHVNKDIITILLLISCSCYLTFLGPDILLHADNYIPADPLATPHHIVPERYLSPPHAMPRSCPSKRGGVCGMLGAPLVLSYPPAIDPTIPSTSDRNP